MNENTNQYLVYNKRNEEKQNKVNKRSTKTI